MTASWFGNNNNGGTAVASAPQPQAPGRVPRRSRVGWSLRRSSTTDAPPKQQDQQQQQQPEKQTWSIRRQTTTEPPKLVPHPPQPPQQQPISVKHISSNLSPRDRQDLLQLQAQRLREQSDISFLLENPEQFARLKKELRRSGAITNTILLHGIHFYARNHQLRSKGKGGALPYRKTMTI